MPVTVCGQLSARIVQISVEKKEDTSTGPAALSVWCYRLAAGRPEREDCAPAKL